MSPRRWLQYVIDHPLHILVPGLIITLFFAFQLPKLHFRTSIYDLAIEDLPETNTYRLFKEQFGCEEIILVVARADNIFEPEPFRKIEQLAKALSEIEGVKKVISLPGIKEDMDVTDKWTLPDFEKSITPIDLFRKNLISSDKKTTVLSLVLEDIEEKNQVIESVEDIMEAYGKGLSLYQTGMPLVSKALAEYTTPGRIF